MLRLSVIWRKSFAQKRVGIKKIFGKGVYFMAIEKKNAISDLVEQGKAKGKLRM